MDRTERLYRIDQLLTERRTVPVRAFLDELGVSLATFKRDLEYLRDRLHAPIVWDRDVGGYRFEAAAAGPKYELPGLWFNAAEVHALLTMQQLLKELQPGLLTPHVEPLLSRLQALLDRADVPSEGMEQRIRILKTFARKLEAAHFAPIATAVLKRRRLRIDYYVKSRDRSESRVISPQRLAHYRDNWYLDAWCHLRDGLRCFALDGIERVQSVDEAALEIDAVELDAELGAGYGIFSGKDVRWAELKFSPGPARYVSREIWHPLQTGRWAEDGAYLLRLPFSDERELTMDILRHGSGVEVLEPESLRASVRDVLSAALKRYG